MDIAIDANIIFAAIIKESTTCDILFHEEIHFFTPEFFFVELEKHLVEVKEKTKRSEEDFQTFMFILRKRITLVPLEELLQYLDEAERICPDPDDVAYFALALKLKCPLWTNDKKLKNQNDIVVYSTTELLTLFSV